jgi:hypothetical protein
MFDETGVRPNPDHDPPPHMLVQFANVVIGRDRKSGNEFLVYGRERFYRFDDASEDADRFTAIIELDQETDDLERLLALVEVLKGRHEYRSDAAA